MSAENIRDRPSFFVPPVSSEPYFGQWTVFGKDNLGVEHCGGSGLMVGLCTYGCDVVDSILI